MIGERIGGRREPRDARPALAVNFRSEGRGAAIRRSDDAADIGDQT
jgi:hypothetical protein